MSASDIAVQVYSDDGKRAREIERGCRAALKRSARTWAPYPLPLDRVEVFASAPPLGKADIYDDWVTATSNAAARSLVVVSLGTFRDLRALTAEEIAGALAGQIELLVADRYRRQHVAEHPDSSSLASFERKVEIAPSNVAEATDPVRETTATADNVTDLGSYREILANMKRNQPLQPTGPSQNGAHPEPDPA
jgi:hypothetical protein